MPKPLVRASTITSFKNTQQNESHTLNTPIQKQSTKKQKLNLPSLYPYRISVIFSQNLSDSQTTYASKRIYTRIKCNTYVIKINAQLMETV